MKHQSHLKTVNQIHLLAVESFRAVVLDCFWGHGRGIFRSTLRLNLYSRILLVVTQTQTNVNTHLHNVERSDSI